MSNPTQNEIRAAQAESLLNNPAFKEALQIVRQAYIERMISTTHEDADGRDHMHKCILALQDLQATLTAFVTSGTIDKVTREKKAKFQG